MKNESIQPLEKVIFTKEPAEAKSEGCCGGAPSTNEDACCQLDEEKKAEGESGCGCNTTAPAKEKSSCC